MVQYHILLIRNKINELAYNFLFLLVNDIKIKLWIDICTCIMKCITILFNNIMKEEMKELKQVNLFYE